MPYNNINDESLPSYIKNKSEVLRKKWIQIFNSTYKKEGEEIAFIVANKWLKNQIKITTTTAKTEQVTREIIRFSVDTKELIKKTDNGEEYISAVLTDNLSDSEGTKLPDEILKKWETHINNNPIIGDIDHEEYDKLLSSGLTDEEVQERLREKPGIAKAIKAIYEKGKLWIQAIIDKRYKKVIEKSKGVSIEAIITKDGNGKIIDGDLLGFTFGINHTPVNPRAQIFT